MDIKNVIVFIVLSILFLGCNGNIISMSPQNPEEIKKLLQGNWYNYDKEWGLIFKDKKVAEYEDGSIRNEGEYILDINTNPIKIIVLENQKEVITYLIKLKNKNTLYIEESIDKESTLLTKVDNLPD